MMNSRTLKRGLLSVFACLAIFTLRAQEEGRYHTIELGLVNQADTLHWCWADTWTEDGKRALQLEQLYTELWAKRMQYSGNQTIIGMEEDLGKTLDENDAYWEELRKT